MNASFISESVYRQTNRTGGGIFQEICADDLPEQFDSNDSSDSKSGAISGVKTGVISGVKSGTDYPTFALVGNREESAREKFSAGSLWSNRVDFACAFSILKTLPL